MDPIEEFIFKRVLMELAKKNFAANDIIVKKVVGGAGGFIVKFFRKVDSDGDGVSDGEEEIYTLDTPSLVLDNGFALVNNDDDEIGIGYPSLKLVDSNDLLPFIQDSDFTGDGNSIFIDLDGDGANEVYKPAPYDGSGDGINDFTTVIDDDDNGLPDVSPHSPFYPVGSEEYETIVQKMSSDSHIMETPLDDYNVSEGLLLIIVILLGFNFVRGLFTRKDVYR